MAKVTEIPTNGSEDPRELIFALVHEIANLLAGSRLEAGLLDPDAGAPELQQIADRTALPAINALSSGVALGDMIAALLSKEAA